MTNKTNQRHRWQTILIRLGLVLALLVVTTMTFGSETLVTAKDKKTAHGDHEVQPVAVAPPRTTPRPKHSFSKPNQRPEDKPQQKKRIQNHLDSSLDGHILQGGNDGGSLLSSAVLPNHTVDPRDMKILLIAPEQTDYDYLAMSAFLNQLGVPFSSLFAAQTTLTASMLWDGVSKGYYQGIILSDGALLYEATPNNWVSAFTDPEWQTLWDYETMFGVRQVTSYTLPGWPDSYGLSDPTYAYQDTSVTPLQTKLTTAGQTVFSYLNATSQITIKSAWTYLATVAPAEAANVTPLLTSANGQYTLGAIKKYADGRENLAITAENNTFITHSQLLSYGIINWVTKGLFLGERHVVMDVQPDDLFIDDDIWDVNAKSDQTGLTFRMGGTDFTKFVNWQAQARTRFPLASGLKIEWPFNAEGAAEDIYPNDTLTPAVLANKANFNYISHTYTHANLDAISAADTTTELQKNYSYGTSKAFSPFYKDAMVQPDISGLYSQTFQQAAYKWGIRYLISDRSRPEWNSPSPNAGFYSTLQSNLLIIPRHAANLFYNLVTPPQWVSEYNCYFGPQATCNNGLWKYWDHNLTYQEILANESDLWLSYLLKWDTSPIMFHQPNAGLYDGTHSLLGDLIDATLTKYSAMYKLPILNLTQHDVGLRMTDRMAYNASGVVGTLYPGSKIVLKVTKAASIPISGLKYGTKTEVYGGQSISTVSLTANQTITITLPK